MYSHLDFNDEWVECACEEECLLGTRVEAEPEVLNQLPLEWVEETYFGGVSEKELGRGSQQPVVYRSWKENGALHRDNGPAMVGSDGLLEWYQNGKLHREGGPAGFYWSDDSWEKEWHQNGLPHRTDGPAIIKPDGTKEWWIKGKFVGENNSEVAEFSHYTFKPARWESCVCEGECIYTTRVEYPVSGIKNLPLEWAKELLGSFVDNEHYRTWVNEKSLAHRVDGNPARVWSDGSKMWYQNGRLHRTDGPASVQHDGYQAWMLDGQFHREDGPAIIHPDGTQEWWTNGIKQN